MEKMEFWPRKSGCSTCTLNISPYLCRIPSTVARNYSLRIFLLSNSVLVIISSWFSSSMVVGAPSLSSNLSSWSHCSDAYLVLVHIIRLCWLSREGEKVKIKQQLAYTDPYNQYKPYKSKTTFFSCPPPYSPCPTCSDQATNMLRRIELYSWPVSSECVLHWGLVVKATGGRKDWRERAKLVFHFPCFCQVCSRWHSGKEFACEYRRHKRCGFDPWVGKIPRRRKWQSTPVLLLGKFHGQRSLAGHSPWGCKESDTTEWLSTLIW